MVRLALIIALMLPAISNAQSVRSADPVADVRAYVAGFCGEATYKPGWDAKGDFNKDGIPDLILRYWIACYEKEQPFCGSKGCMTQIWFGQPDGTFARALAHYVLAVEPTTYKGVSALKIYTDGLACGKSAGQVCEAINTWSGGEFLTVWANHDL